MNRFLNKANKRVSLGGAATLLIAVALMSQALGFLRNRLLSTNFDQGSTDAFFAAFMLPDFFYYTIAAGALGVAFIPFLSDRLEAGDRKGAWMLASSLLNVLLVAMGITAIIIFLFASPLVGLIAPSLASENHDQAVTIMRLIALNPLFFSLAGILTSVQQTFGRFFFYAISPLTYNLTIIVAIFISRDSIGIIGLGVGALIGGLIQLIVACLGLVGLSFQYRPRIAWGSGHFRNMLRQLPPRSLDQGIDQVNSLVETNRANLLGRGMVSNYNYALTLHNVPIMMLGTTIATAAFPRLTERLSQKRPDLFRKDFLNILRTLIWMTMPIIVIAYFTRGYLARLIFGNNAPEVALIFGYLVIAIFFRIVYAMVSRYFYAHKDTKTPLFVSIFAIALNIYLAFTLTRPESQGGYGIAGLALAQSFVAASEVAVLSCIMIIRDPKLIDWKFWSGIWRIMSVTGFTLVAAYIMLSILPLQAADRGFLTLVTKLSLISSVVLVTHTAISWLFDIEEARTVVAKAKQVILRPIKFQ